MRVCFQLTDVTAIRLARGVPRLRTIYNGHRSTLLWRLGYGSEDLQVLQCEGTNIDVASVVGDRFKDSRPIQLIFGTEGACCTSDIVDVNASSALDTPTFIHDTPTDDDDDDNNDNHNDNASDNDDRLSFLVTALTMMQSRPY